jgi:biotin transport system substrate-specific component
MKTRNLLLCALFAALTAVGALIRIPIPGMTMPITLQVFFMIMAGLLLEPKYALISQLVYMAIGLLGLPVFSSGGGLSYVLAPSFGYVPGFAVCALLLSALVRKRLIGFNRVPGSKAVKLIQICSFSLVSLVSMYILGIAYMYLIFRFYMNNPRSIGDIIVTYNGIFFFIDLIKLAVALPVCAAVLRRLPGSKPIPQN